MELGTEVAHAKRKSQVLVEEEEQRLESEKRKLVQKQAEIDMELQLLTAKRKEKELIVESEEKLVRDRRKAELEAEFVSQIEDFKQGIACRKAKVEETVE